jgi:hypothetical protein
MKPKQLFAIFILTFFFTCKVSFSQTNTYFLNNPVWQVFSSCAVPLPCIRNEYYNYYVNGDTIINSLVYKKIYKQGQVTYSWMAAPPWGCSGSYNYVDTFPTYFMRSVGKKIFLHQYDTTDYLLYDFNLSIGDTLPLSLVNSATDLVVAEIDSIFTTYGYRKRFRIVDGGSTTTYLIEGIGHLNGLVEPLNVVFECGYSLVCFSLNDTAYFPSIGTTCNLLLGIVSLKDEKPPAVFPNPFDNFTTIYFNPITEFAELIIFNIEGQIIRTMKDISGGSVKIERGSLSSGFYFYELRQESKIIASGKLIVMD